MGEKRRKKTLRFTDLHAKRFERKSPGKPFGEPPRGSSPPESEDELVESIHGTAYDTMGGYVTLLQEITCGFC